MQVSGKRGTKLITKDRAGLTSQYSVPEEVYSDDGTTNQVYIETPPEKAQYSMRETKDEEDGESDLYFKQGTSGNGNH